MCSTVEDTDLHMYTVLRRLHACHARTYGGAAPLGVETTCVRTARHPSLHRFYLPMQTGGWGQRVDVVHWPLGCFVCPLSKSRRDTKFSFSMPCTQQVDPRYKSEFRKGGMIPALPCTTVRCTSVVSPPRQVGNRIFLVGCRTSISYRLLQVCCSRQTL